MIIETLEFLGAGHKDWNNEKKSTCVHELIYRIQSLLPETCAICKDSYTILKDDPRYLSCSVCKQEVHRECYMPLLKVCEKNLVDTIFNIPGIHYLCSSCEYDHIPDDAASLKRKKVTGNQTELSEITKAIEKIAEVGPGTTKKDEPPIILKSILVTTRQGADISHVKNVSFSPDISSNTNSIQSISHGKKNTHIQPTVHVKNEERKNTSEPHTKVCSHYVNNTCKFGMKGKECPFLHPKRCTKLMNFGTKTDKGCNLGKKCKDFHPKMCPLSIAKGECFDERCQLCHVKGTKRRKPLEKVTDKKKEETKPNPQDKRPERNEDKDDSQSFQQSFLEQIRLLKVEIQEAVDLKLSALLRQAPPPPSNVQASYQQLQPTAMMPLSQQFQQQIPMQQIPMPLPQQFQQQIPMQQIPMPQPQMPHIYPMQTWYPTCTYPQTPVPQLYQQHLSTIA